MQLQLGAAVLDRLRVGVGGDELHPVHAAVDHVRDRVAAAAAHADDLDVGIGCHLFYQFEMRHVRVLVFKCRGWGFGIGASEELLRLPCPRPAARRLCGFSCCVTAIVCLSPAALYSPRSNTVRTCCSCRCRCPSQSRIPNPQSRRVRQNSQRYQFFNLLKSDPERPVGIPGRPGCSIWLPISSRPTPLACTGLLTTSPRPVTCCGMPTRTGICSISDRKSTSELQSLMRISYAVFCLNKKKKQQQDVYSKE